MPKNTSATILVVDDEPANLTVLATLLRPYFKVLAANSGKQALRVANKTPGPDLILLDVRMPEMDGFAVLKQLRESNSASMIPVIVVTALSEEVDEERGLKLGAVDYIGKPIKGSIVLARIRTQLELKQARDQLRQQNIDLDARVQVRTAQLRTALGKIETSHQELKLHYRETVKAFSKFVSLREGKATGHTRRLAERAQLLARGLDISGEDLQDIVFAALLFQVGKLTLPDKLIDRPLNALQKSERETFFRQAVTMAAVLKDIQPLNHAALLIAQQYECFDGSGVPSGLVGKDISLGARILSVVRDYDFLLDGRITGKPMIASEAQDHMLRLRGRKGCNPSSAPVKPPTAGLKWGRSRHILGIGVGIRAGCGIR